MKTHLILLLITVGFVSLADAERIVKYLPVSTSGTSQQEDPLKFLELYLENAKHEFEQKYNHPQRCTGGLSDYVITAWLGKGGTSQVVLGQIRGTGTYHAIKIVHKEDVINTGQVDGGLREKRISQAVNFPFLMKMESCFKDNSNLYFAMEYCPCGTLTTGLSENVVQFYAAQIVLALHYLHSMNLIYQDLKLENVLIGQDGYIKLADFGFSTLALDGLADKHAGTVAYMAPEMLHYENYDKKVDWWSLGVVIYRMISDRRPFGVYSGDTWNQAYQDISRTQLRFDDRRFSKEVKDLLKNLLQKAPLERYGIEEIVKHKWFKDINWQQLYRKRTPLPYQPHCRNPETFQDKIDGAIGYISSYELYSEEFQDFR